jgi:hypothetical protein
MEFRSFLCSVVDEEEEEEGALAVPGGGGGGAGAFVTASRSRSLVADSVALPEVYPPSFFFDLELKCICYTIHSRVIYSVSALAYIR